MNREQMIAWLTIEGWDSIRCANGESYARHAASRKFKNINSRTLVPHLYAPKSQIGAGKSTEWEGWDEISLMCVISAAEGDEHEP